MKNFAEWYNVANLKKEASDYVTEAITLAFRNFSTEDFLKTLYRKI